MPLSSNGQSFDIAIAGGGIFGLSIAYAAIRLGLKVAVFEADKVGAGASGGLLGALMPHMPARWNPKKEFQFRALKSLEEHTHALELETGMHTGYRRCGRILPLTTKDKLEHHLERAEESKLRWNTDRTGFSYQVEQPGERGDWLSPDAAPFGLVYETLAARVSPRAYIATLAAYIRQHGVLVEGAAVHGFEESTGRVFLTGGHPDVHAAHVVYASGHASFRAIESLTGEAVGRGEKGQAVLLEGEGLEHLPAIYCDGLYVVPHENGTVAVGSTADKVFEHSEPLPERTEELVRRAAAFCPKLNGRAILSEWAGIRPRCNKRDPLVGKLPGYARTYVATGGYKISFGVAHAVADALLGEIYARSTEAVLPDTFRPEHHFGDNALRNDTYQPAVASVHKI
ncbi:glycine/D-amino acid oxidase-like deaminating enzyme [Roseibium hamelinense]|uniref:Glycine/D-amino acid oxidase-like deaminating enzyme n=1 Tax=Roseibium hamelinense TaxID=150831 RepID=A0A562TJ59_9HYPH|nr:FAD-dependent oxidoreductase [Roseibium hamelinense]MTI42776.1 FAD-binding oxidoreductase [Roseibium hamelinense]TWI93424.1 glycine/D-amino acid oxidase-like deaminating enzyme [Roseibium hamelinense]